MKAKKKKKLFTFKCPPEELLKLSPADQEKFSDLFAWEKMSAKRNFILGMPSSY